MCNCPLMIRETLSTGPLLSALMENTQSLWVNNKQNKVLINLQYVEFSCYPICIEYLHVWKKIQQLKLSKRTNMFNLQIISFVNTLRTIDYSLVASTSENFVVDVIFLIIFRYYNMDSPTIIWVYFVCVYHSISWSTISVIEFRILLKNSKCRFN